MNGILKRGKTLRERERERERILQNIFFCEIQFFKNQLIKSMYYFSVCAEIN